MIAIPNMDKPKDCWECSFAYLWANGSTYCMADGQELYCDGVTTRNDCPLIEIVQCNECKYRHEHEWYNTCDKHIGHGFEDDYFCKDGERRMIWE